MRRSCGGNFPTAEGWPGLITGTMRLGWFYTSLEDYMTGKYSRFGLVNESDEFLEWHRVWLERLGKRKSGVTVLFGPPGCGKTSFLRALMARLIAKYVFYFLPVGEFDALSSPGLVSFWAGETGRYKGKQKIAILEDAEDLLMPRDQGTRTKVSDLLNIADGFLGDHLRLHVVATTNAPVPRLDPAIARPGRLIGVREFR